MLSMALRCLASVWHCHHHGEMQNIYHRLSQHCLIRSPQDCQIVFVLRSKAASRRTTLPILR